MGIAVMHPELSLEVMLDEHKLLVVYAQSRQPFERILKGRGLVRDDRLRFISQGEHMHTSNTRYARRFQELTTRLGAG
jgi:predicted metal-dependent phosphoesterase TrpH